MAKRKAEKRKVTRRRAPEQVEETTEEYWDEEESSTSTSELSWSDPVDRNADSSVSAASGGGQPPPIQRRMKTVKPKPLRTLMGHDLSKPRKRKITLLQE